MRKVFFAFIALQLIFYKHNGSKTQIIRVYDTVIEAERRRQYGKGCSRCRSSCSCGCRCGSKKEKEVGEIFWHLSDNEEICLSEKCIAKETRVIVMR